MSDKLKELMLYIAEQSEGDVSFGAIKLNKLLFFSDFRCYARTGQSITGERYQKLELGPAPRRLLPAQEELVRDGAAAVGERFVAGYKQKRLLALREPDLEAFTGLEIATVDRVLREFFGHTATHVSDYSHEFIGWRAVDIGEDIPYETVWVSEREPSEADFEYGRTIAARCRKDTAQ